MAVISGKFQIPSGIMMRRIVVVIAVLAVLFFARFEGSSDGFGARREAMGGRSKYRNGSGGIYVRHPPLYIAAKLDGRGARLVADAVALWQSGNSGAHFAWF